MTAVGKLLVFLNVFAGAALFSWALSAYANRLDWLDSKTEAGTTEGQLTVLNKEIARLSKAAADAQTAYSVRSGLLARTEADRDYRRDQYKVRLDVARGVYKDPTGRPVFDPFVRMGDPAAPFREQLPFQPGQGNTSFVNLGVVGRPVLAADNRPLRGLADLRKEFADQLRESQAAVYGVAPGEADLNVNEKAAIATPMTADEFATFVGKFGLAKLRAAHGLLSDQVAAVDAAAEAQKEIRKNLGEEAAFIGSSRVNWIAQLQTLERRQRQLEGRLKEYGGGE